MFKLISDTSCDWIKEYAEEHNVTLVPLYTTFDGQTYYKEQFEISYDEFYRKMTDENAFPKSSLPSIQDYVDDNKTYGLIRIEDSTANWFLFNKDESEDDLQKLYK